jgi:hypothetical protein
MSIVLFPEIAARVCLAQPCPCCHGLARSLTLVTELRIRIGGLFRLAATDWCDPRNARRGAEAVSASGRVASVTRKYGRRLKA